MSGKDDPAVSDENELNQNRKKPRLNAAERHLKRGFGGFFGWCPREDSNLHVLADT